VIPLPDGLTAARPTSPGGAVETAKAYGCTPLRPHAVLL